MSFALPLKFPNLRLSGNTDVIVLSLLVAALIPVGLLLTDVMNVLALVALPIIILVIMLFVRYPRLWLYTGAVVNYFWVSSGKGENEITLKEYALVAFIIGGLWIWLFSMVFVKKRRIVRNLGDRVLLTAILGASITIVLVLVNDESTPLRWLREYLLFYTMLYYLPWREHFTERKHILTFLTLTSGVFIIIGASNLWQYVKAASNVLYAYEVWTSRKSLITHVFICATIFCAMGAFYASARKARLGMLVLTAFYAVVVVVSFSRGFWISCVIGIVATLWLCNKRKLALFLVYSIIGGIIFISAVQVIFPERAALILKVIQARLVSSAEGTKDLSLSARVYETQSVFEYIARYPFSGAGMGTRVTVYDPMAHIFNKINFIHNGYLYIWMKLGLPFFLSFYGVWFYMLYKAYTLARHQLNTAVSRILASGAFGSLLAFTLVNVTSAIPEGREGFYCLSVIYAAIAFAELDRRLHFHPSSSSTSHGITST
jgi:hypothetical protein